MKKILLITRGIPSVKSPVWGNFELDQAKAMQAAGYKVVCMSIDRRIRFYWRKIGITHKQISGVDLYNIFFPLPYRILPRFIHNYFVDKLAKKLFQYVQDREGEFDLIHGHYLQNIRIATVIKKERGIPVVGTEHWSDLKKESLSSAIVKDAFETYPQVDQLITVSYPLQRTLKKKFNAESVFIGCVIDDVFDYVPKSKSGCFRFLDVGALIKRKGFDIAIKAFAKAGFDESVKLHIIGEGRLRGQLQRLINQLALTKQVILEGHKSRGEIMEFMKGPSAYVLSSKVENFATACMEALSTGTPAVMTRCGGPEYFVDESNAVLVDVDNIDQMADALRYMYDNLHKYDFKSISENMRKKYSEKAVSAQLDEIYSRLIK